MRLDERHSPIRRPGKKRKYLTGLTEVKNTLSGLTELYEKAEREEKKREEARDTRPKMTPRKAHDPRYYRYFIERIIENKPIVEDILSKPHYSIINELDAIIKARMQNGRSFRWLLREYIKRVDPQYALRFVKVISMRLNALSGLQLRLYREFIGSYKDLYRDIYLSNDILLIYAIEYFESLLMHKEVNRMQFAKYMKDRTTMDMGLNKRVGSISGYTLEKLSYSYANVRDKVKRLSYSGNMRTYLEYILHVVIEDIKYAQDKGTTNVLYMEHRKLYPKIKTDYENMKYKFLLTQSVDNMGIAQSSGGITSKPQA